MKNSDAFYTVEPTGADIPTAPGETAGGGSETPTRPFRKWADMTPDELDEALESLERKGIHPLTLQAWLHAKSLPEEVKQSMEDMDTDYWDIPLELASQRENDASDEEFVYFYYDEVEEAAKKLGLIPVDRAEDQS